MEKTINHTLKTFVSERLKRGAIRETRSSKVRMGLTI